MLIYLGIPLTHPFIYSFFHTSKMRKSGSFTQDEPLIVLTHKYDNFYAWMDIRWKNEQNT